MDGLGRDGMDRTLLALRAVNLVHSDRAIRPAVVAQVCTLVSQNIKSDVRVLFGDTVCNTVDLV